MANFNWTFVNVDGIVNVNAISASTYISASTIYATTITASNFVTVNKLTIDISGSTTFGNSNDDMHIRTGSLLVNSSSTSILSASVSATPGSSFIYASKLGVGVANPPFTLTVAGDISGSAGLTGSSLNTAETVINATHISSSLNISGTAFYGDGTKLTGMSPITTYNNSSDNRVLTSVDSSTINSEANLTFDGTTLTVAGTISGSGNISGSNIYVENNIILGDDQAIFFEDDLGTYIESDTADRLRFVVGANQMLLLDEDEDRVNIGYGNKLGVGLGNHTTPSASLHISGSGAANALFQVTSDGGLGSLFVSGSGKVGIGTIAPDYDLDVAGTVGIANYIYHNGDSNTYLLFEDNLVNLVAGGQSAIKLELSTGKIQLNNGNDDLDVQVMADDGEVILHTDGATNRVGIGTDAPQTELHVVGSITASSGITGSAFETATTAINSTHISSSLNISGAAFYGNGAKLTGMSPITTYNNVADNRILTAVNSSTITGEANLTFDGTDLSVVSATSARPRFYIQNENADQHPGQLVFNKTSSSPAEDDTIGRVVFSSHDAAGNATVYGQMEGEIKKSDSGGERGRIKFSVAEYDGALTEAFTLQGDNADGTVSVTVANGTLNLPNGNIHLYDDRKIIFGTNSDSSIEYDETGRNILRISGSQGGVEISGSGVLFDPGTVVSGAIGGPGSYLGIDTAGKLVLTASSGGGTPGGSDTQIQYNNGGAFGGVASLTFNDSSGDLTVIDDEKLFFGTNSDAHIEYDEDGDNQLIISGSISGIAVLSDNVIFKTAQSTRPRIYIQNENADQHPGQLIFNKTSSSPTEDDTIGRIVFSSHDAAGNATVYGQIDGEIKKSTSGGERGRIKFTIAEYDGTATEAFTLQGDAADGSVSVTVANGTLNVPNGNIHLYDDRKIIFGTNSDSSIEYDETGRNILRISGSQGGIEISGSGILFDPVTIASGAVGGPGSYVGINSAGKLVLTASGGGDISGDNNTFSGTNTFSGQLTASAGINIAGGISLATAVKTADFTAANNEYMFFCDLTGAVITGTLPPAADVGAGKSYIFKDVSGSASNFNLVVSGSDNQTIDGAKLVKVTSNSGSVTCMSNGVNWFIIGTS